MRTTGTYNDCLALAASTWCQRSCMRSGVLHVACGNRREAVCPACSAVYKRDARQLVRAGLAGSKGIPETITAHPRVFATLTAPSFGPVHSRRLRGKTVLPCVPVATPMRARCPQGCPTGGSSRSSPARRGPVAGRASDLLGDHRHACYSTSDAAHRTQDLRGDPGASCGECCAITPRLLHRCNLSPHSHPQTVLNFPRRYTDLCGHRRACADALLLDWRAQASRGTHTGRSAGEATDRGPVFGPAHGRPACRWTACSSAVDTALLQSLRARKQRFRARAWACARQARHAAVIQ